MKKFVYTLVALFVMTVFFSCKSQEKCPAYGKVNVKTEKLS